MIDNKELLSKYNYLRVACCRINLKLGNVEGNAEEVISACIEMDGEGAKIIVFSEQTLTGYSIDDLYHQKSICTRVENAIKIILQRTQTLNSVIIIGVPVAVEDGLFNAALVTHQGKIYGVHLKEYLPTHSEFYESRYFSSSNSLITDSVRYAGNFEIPIGTKLIFQLRSIPDATFAVEICEDLWAPIPPSSFSALAGARIICNLSASNASIGKADYRRNLVLNQSAKTNSAYIYCSSGSGESTTDLCWDGHCIISENGNLLSEIRGYEFERKIINTDIDIDRLKIDRIKNSSFKKARENYNKQLREYRRIIIKDEDSNKKNKLIRKIEKNPYVPNDIENLGERCIEIFEMQSQGLIQRLNAMRASRVVIGISGGLDSTLALLVCAHAFDKMHLPRDNIHAYTMPAYATSDQTKQQALDLMNEIGCTANFIDITASCDQMLKDIGHDYAAGIDTYDITFENVQAGERTSHLFRLANKFNCPVIGTGDLSELALGWCTYGVGDHMSHYNVNASVPKTLVQYIIRTARNLDFFGDRLNGILTRILDTDISPELVPANGKNYITQKTEDIIGPYELHDFFLYYTLRYGFGSEKIIHLCCEAWTNDDKYSKEDIVKIYSKFRSRFFMSSQYKRSVAVNGPKIGNGGSLSPRGDWRAPSDIVSEI